MLTPHWLDKVVGDLILGGPTTPAQVVILHLEIGRRLGQSSASITAHLPTSCTSRQTSRSGTHTAGRFHCRNTLHPASCTIEWTANSPPHSPSTDA